MLLLRFQEVWEWGNNVSLKTEFLEKKKRQGIWMAIHELINSTQQHNRLSLTDLSPR